jgi:predicted ATPase/transcriptional regulator with XRE-family HTH domain
MELREPFGTLLIRGRRTLGWSQEELAERAGVSVRTIRNMETGAIRVPRHSSTTLVLAAFRSAGVPDMELAAGQPARIRAEHDVQQCSTLSKSGSVGGLWHTSPQNGPDSLVGRALEIESICKGIACDRWNVLIGPGGVGKTRLALAVGDRLRHSFADGIAVARLGGLTSEHDDAPAAALSVRQAVLDAIARDHTRVDEATETRKLVIIDNAEHVLESVAETCQRVLDLFPGVRLLVTSRRFIALPETKTWEIQPLGVEGGGESESRAVEAVELFLQRVHSACPALDLAGQMPAVAKLCRTLDGVPLVLELAALRLRSFSIDTLLRNGPIRQIIEQTNANGLAHQRTLMDSVGWSVELLGQRQRRLLRRLCEFRGVFTIADILSELSSDQLSSDQMAGAQASRIEDSVSELVDSSLLQVRRGPEYGYFMLGYVRETVRCLAPS